MTPTPSQYFATYFKLVAKPNERSHYERLTSSSNCQLNCHTISCSCTYKLTVSCISLNKWFIHKFIFVSFIEYLQNIELSVLIIFLFIKYPKHDLLIYTAILKFLSNISHFHSISKLMQNKKHYTIINSIL